MATIVLEPGGIKRYSVKTAYPINFKFSIKLAQTDGYVNFTQYDKRPQGCGLTAVMPSTIMLFSPKDGWVHFEITNETKEWVQATIQPAEK